MAENLHRLIYCSRAAIEGGPEAVQREIQSILTDARRENRRTRVTGALLFTHGCFVQTLEGEPAALEEVYERIQCDERHRDVTVLSFEPVAVRAFPGVDMAYLVQDEAHPSPDWAATALNDTVPNRLMGEKDVVSLMHRVVALEWALART